MFLKIISTTIVEYNTSIFNSTKLKLFYFEYIYLIILSHWWESWLITTKNWGSICTQIL